MRSRFLVLGFSILTLLSACQQERQTNESWMDPAASVTNTMPPPADAPEAAAGATFVVTLNDGHIATQEVAIPPGPAVLTVMNAGKEVHGLHVEGPGVQAALERPIANGESGTIDVTFQQGTYELYCPMLDHRQKGETLPVPVSTP